MRRRLSILLFLITISNIKTADIENWDWGTEPDKSGLRIRLVRATATNLYVRAECEGQCSNVTWVYWTHQFMGPSISSRRIVQRIDGNTYALRHLVPRSHYFVQAKMGDARASMRANTCSSYLGDLRNLRVRTGGPGWLDIRWEPPHTDVEVCASDIQYAMRYKLEGDAAAQFTEYSMYGIYPIDRNGTLRAGPTHPCEEWPKEFCLLVTEHIIAGNNYTIEIIPSRVGGEPEEKGEVQTVHGYADPFLQQGYGDFGIHPECIMWAWVASGASIFSFAVVVAMLVSTFVATIQKREKMAEEEIAENDEINENEETETEQ